MTLAERLVLWNLWYDNVSEEWRFQFVVWSLLILGAINMVLTISVGFPFALLVVLGIIVIAAIRLPYFLGWVNHHQTEQTDPRFEIAGAGWLIDLNHRYEAMPESRRFWVYPAILLIAGAINMMLTIGYGFPFGLLFLLALLALVFVRAPFTAGWLRQQPSVSTAPAADDPALGHNAVLPISHLEEPPVTHEPGPRLADNEVPEHHPTEEPRDPHDGAI